MRRNRDERNNSWAKAAVLKVSRVLVSIAQRSATGAELEIDSASREFTDSFGYSAEHFPMPFSKLVSSANELKSYLLIERALLMKTTTSQYVNLKRISGETLSCHVVVTSYQNRKSNDPSTLRLQAIMTIRSASVVANSAAVGTLLFEPAEQTRLTKQALEEYIGGDPAKYEQDGGATAESMALAEAEVTMPDSAEARVQASSPSSLTNQGKRGFQRSPQLDLPPALPSKSARPLISVPRSSRKLPVPRHPSSQTRVPDVPSQSEPFTLSIEIPRFAGHPSHAFQPHSAHSHIPEIQAHLQMQMHTFFQQLMHKQARGMGAQEEPDQKRQRVCKSPITLPLTCHPPRSPDVLLTGSQMVTPPSRTKPPRVPMRPKAPRVLPCKETPALSAPQEDDDEAFNSALELLCAPHADGGKDEYPPHFQTAALYIWDDAVEVTDFQGRTQGNGSDHLRGMLKLQGQGMEYQCFDELETSSLLELDAFDI
ncbi:hypothetical protein B484DRAFT_400787 [Ochromonadaceae sp. CCMP2298]|nr:hypothetical protein B484DRAFT_400787 [Ochromonadaceae sp. CCMP2298]|mmetsp:Transcript_13951/g.30802  ORF Transcript_13951/g.30802 Transcript_13951/m.30802 type:complete len:483 (+) Transcript_13951:387-1835(+)